MAERCADSSGDSRVAMRRASSRVSATSAAQAANGSDKESGRDKESTGSRDAARAAINDSDSRMAVGMDDKRMMPPRVHMQYVAGDDRRSRMAEAN
jgi:hypothetical protein